MLIEVSELIEIYDNLSKVILSLHLDNPISANCNKFSTVAKRRVILGSKNVCSKCIKVIPLRINVVLPNVIYVEKPP